MSHPRVVLHCFNAPNASAPTRLPLPSGGVALKLAADMKRQGVIVVLVRSQGATPCCDCRVNKQECHRCGGKGRIEAHRTCVTCAGTGELINEGTGGTVRMLVDGRTIRKSYRWYRWIRRQPAKWTAFAPTDPDDIDVTVCSTCNGDGSDANLAIYAAARAAVVEAVAAPGSDNMVSVSATTGIEPGYYLRIAADRDVVADLRRGGFDVSCGTSVDGDIVSFSDPIPYAGPSFAGVKNIPGVTT